MDICLSQLPTIIEEGTAFRVSWIETAGVQVPRPVVAFVVAVVNHRGVVLSLPQHSPFFAEQLTAFQVWLTMGVENRNPPEQLPIVLQVRAPGCPAPPARCQPARGTPVAFGIKYSRPYVS